MTPRAQRHCSDARWRARWPPASREGGREGEGVASLSSQPCQAPSDRAAHSTHPGGTLRRVAVRARSRGDARESSLSDVTPSLFGERTRGEAAARRRSSLRVCRASGVTCLSVCGCVVGRLFPRGRTPQNASRYCSASAGAWGGHFFSPRLLRPHAGAPNGAVKIVR